MIDIPEKLQGLDRAQATKLRFKGFPGNIAALARICRTFRLLSRWQETGEVLRIIDTPWCRLNL